MTEIPIGNKLIHQNSPVFIIAELSANHNHDFEIALQTVKAAKEAGADAIKIQTYTADTITIDAKTPYFQINQGTVWDGKTLYELYKEAYTPWEWQPKLKAYAEELGLIFFSSPFDATAVDFLEKLEVPLYKVASFEITDIPLIKYMASKHKPMILSTGIATEEDVQDAIEACQSVGNNQIILLKCTSAYPAPFGEVNLNTIPFLREKFRVLVGLSDHTTGISVPIASVALGAKVIEKHFILDRSMGGADSGFSLEPSEFKAMVASIREVEQALGVASFEMTEKIKKSREFSRSLFVVKDMKAGEAFTNENIRSIRPGFGLPPKFIDQVMGQKATKNLVKGTPLSWELIG